MKNLVFNPIRNISIKYYANKKVFNPTRTSKIIIKAIYKKRKFYSKYKKILDLGCGTGVLGIAVKKILKKAEINFSDLSPHAIALSKKNLNLNFNKIEYEIRQSDLLNKWSDKKFDIIVNDVSAISSYFKKKNLWYNESIPCDSGLDGVKNSIKFLNVAANQCKIIIMPLISLSNITFVKKYIKRKNLKYTVLAKEDWPLPINLVKKNSKTLIKMKKKKMIDFKIQYGMYIAYTEVIQIKT